MPKLMRVQLNANLGGPVISAFAASCPGVSPAASISLLSRSANVSSFPIVRHDYTIPLPHVNNHKCALILENIVRNPDLVYLSGDLTTVEYECILVPMNSTVVAFLRLKRRSLGITQKEQAKALGISVKALALMEKGREPSSRMLKQLYRAYPDSLQVIISYLTTRVHHRREHHEHCLHQ